MLRSGPSQKEHRSLRSPMSSRVPVSGAPVPDTALSVVDDCTLQDQCPHHMVPDVGRQFEASSQRFALQSLGIGFDMCPCVSLCYRSVIMSVLWKGEADQ